jgi:hypothetical protein
MTPVRRSKQHQKQFLTMSWRRVVVRTACAPEALGAQVDRKTLASPDTFHPLAVYMPAGITAQVQPRAGACSGKAGKGSRRG